MARRSNEMFIGSEFMNADGPSIKHPALISLYANVNSNKIMPNPIKLIGLDLETNHKTGELKLLGFYDGSNYNANTSDFLEVLFAYCKHASFESISLAYWNRLDPFVLFKQFLYKMDDKAIKNSLSRFGKISGEWNRKLGSWDVAPVCEIELYDGIYFGIRNVVRSSVQFFYRKEGSTFCNTVWAYDIAQLYEKGLEAEALDRLPYYSKVDKSAHLVDWVRFETDSEYKKLVLWSNELDSRAVYDLGNQIQEEFKTAFSWYPNTLVSTGLLAQTVVYEPRQKEGNK